MEEKDDEIRDQVAKKVVEQWAINRTPYLLSSIGIDLKLAGIDYHKLAGPGVTLSKYIASIAQGRFKVVSHPVIKARVGAIPSTEDYDFPEVEKTTDTPTRPAAERARRLTPKKYVVLNFLEALSDLPQEDLEKINLPISVLAKLLSRQ